VNHTGAALAGVTADMRSSETKIFAKELDKQQTRFDLAGYPFSVHGHCHNRHRFSPLSS
jgi:hypothetical protein